MTANAGAILLATVVRIWALPVTLAAAPLLLLATLSGGRTRIVRGVIESDGGALARLLALLGPRRGIEAITLGHVVLARSSAAQERHRAHEREHVRQYQRWGLLFPIAYLCASVVAWLRHGDLYRDNAFERAARAAAGEAETA